MARTRGKSTDTAATVLDAVVTALERAAAYNRDDTVAPAAVLWPDKDRQWEPLVPRLRSVLPQLLTLGGYDAAARTGPAIWLRCMIARALPGADWPADAPPVVYLPGVSKQELRAVEECPPPLQPLAELQYRGALFTQLNGKDWTISAFLQSADGGLGLDVARDHATLEAMKRAIAKLADVPVEHLRGKRLEAEDFDQLMTPDPARELLGWMNDPAGARRRHDDAAWEAFCGICRERYRLDPAKDGEVTAAEYLGLHGRGAGPWSAAWKRFEESPRLYPNLKALLRRAKPAAAGDLFSAPSPTWPQDNEQQEADLRSALKEAGKLAPAEAAQRIGELEREHAPRRQWVWARLGDAPLARAVEHLAAMAASAAKPLAGADIEAMAGRYAEEAWKTDAAVLEVLACTRDARDAEAVRAVIRAVYQPWLEAAAEHFQKLMNDQIARGSAESAGGKVQVPEGCCVLFADGLRFDVGRRLADALTAEGLAVEAGRRWTALPPVTATTKPAVAPIADQIGGGTGEDFQPAIRATSHELTTDRFRQLLDAAGVQVLAADSTGDPARRAWTEHGAIDHRGHEEGWKLAWRIEEEVRGLVQRIADLLAAGWREVRVVTDHGWLLLPGGLPKVKMPSYLTETRWGRCAALQAGSTPKVQTIPWSWNPDVRVAVAPGIACFKAGTEYAHGSLSIQECLVPTLTVRSAASAGPSVTIRSVRWRRLVCKVELDGETAGCTVDLRSRAADAVSSMAADKEARPVEADNTASLYADDEHQGAAAVVVVLGRDGKVIVKQPTTVGGEE